MWIKHTKVKSKSGTYTYLQLVQSERIQGKTRHKVLANFGRADRLDREEVFKLLEAIQSSTKDSLDPKQIRLLPAKKFGIPLVMEYALKSLGIWRFLSELSMHKKTEPLTTSAVFALLVYYTVSKEPNQLFSDFYKEYFFPAFLQPIPLKTLEAAFRFMQDREPFRSGFLKGGERREPCFHYVYRAINDNLKKISRDAAVLVVLDQAYTILDFLSLKQSYTSYRVWTPEDGFVSDSYELLRGCQSFDPQKSRYICKIRQEHLSELFEESQKALEFCRSKGVFLNYKGIGYRTRRFGAKTILVLRPQPGVAVRVPPGRYEAREILVSSMDSTPEEILERYLYLEKLQSYYFNIFLPRDLEAAGKRLPARSVLRSVETIIFLKILCLDFIERQVRELNMTAEDILWECDNILGVQLSGWNFSRVFHSSLTPMQTELLGKLGVPKPPVAELWIRP